MNARVLNLQARMQCGDPMTLADAQFVGELAERAAHAMPTMGIPAMTALERYQLEPLLDAAALDRPAWLGHLFSFIDKLLTVRADRSAAIAWLGYWRDGLPPEAVSTLQDALGVPPHCPECAKQNAQVGGEFCCWCERAALAKARGA